MFIVSKDKNSIVNAEQITAIFVGADNCSIKADFQNGKSCQLGRYNSEAAARISLDMVAPLENQKSALCRMMMP